MNTLIDLSKRAAIALAIACVALPAAAFDGPTSFDSGGDGPDDPGFGGPDGFAAPEGGGGGGGGASPTTGGGDSIVGQRYNECPNGNMVVEYDMDTDGHPIPSSFSRNCVRFR